MEAYLDNSATTRPEDCTEKRHIRPMERKVFGKEENNFVGLEEFTDEEVED